MRILEQGERTGTCSKCNAVFAYTEDDLKTNYKNRDKHGFIRKYKYVICPCCKAEIAESQLN